jgi:hypothetical protein
LLGILVGFFESVGGAREEMFPHDVDDEVEERDDIEGSKLGTGRFAPDEEVEQLEADRVALNIKSGITISMPFNIILEMEAAVQSQDLEGIHTASQDLGYQ